MDIISKGMKFRKGLSSPFGEVDVMQLQYCRHCKMETDFMRRSYCVGTVYGTKVWCRRCGFVKSCGAYSNVHVVTAIPDSTFTLAQEWMVQREAPSEGLKKQGGV